MSFKSSVFSNRQRTSVANEVTEFLNKNKIANNMIITLNFTYDGSTKEYIAFLVYYDLYDSTQTNKTIEISDNNLSE